MDAAGLRGCCQTALVASIFAGSHGQRAQIPDETNVQEENTLFRNFFLGMCELLVFRNV